MSVSALIGRFSLYALLWLVSGLWAGTAQAQNEEIQRRLAEITYETGTVQLPRANARMEIPSGWKFLSMERLAGVFQVGADSIRELDQLGFLLPATADITAPDAWWVNVSSFDSGYIAMDIERIEPYALTWRTRDVYKWASRRDGRRWEFVNYGRAPITDTSRNICLWTERLRYPEDGGNELLDVYGMALSRRGGVIVEVEYMPNEWQDAVESAVEQLVRSIRFNIGERYEDHNPSDPIAEYEMSHIITGEFWLGPQTWSAWLREPVRLGLGSGWKKIKINVPNWLFWGGVLLVLLLSVVLWLRGGGEQHRHVSKVKGARR